MPGRLAIIVNVPFRHPPIRLSSESKPVGIPGSTPFAALMQSVFISSKVAFKTTSCIAPVSAPAPKSVISLIDLSASCKTSSMSLVVSPRCTRSALINPCHMGSGRGVQCALAMRAVNPAIYAGPPTCDNVPFLPISCVDQHIDWLVPRCKRFDCRKTSWFSVL